MPRCLMVVGSNPVDAAQEDAFNEWYTEAHLDDVIAVAGFRSARRYVLNDARPMAGTVASPFRYLAIYEIESDDLQQTARDLQAALDSGAIPISDAFDLNGFTVDFYEFIPGTERPA